MDVTECSDVVIGGLTYRGDVLTEAVAPVHLFVRSAVAPVRLFVRSAVALVRLFFLMVVAVVGVGSPIAHFASRLTCETNKQNINVYRHHQHTHIKMRILHFTRQY